MEQMIVATSADALEGRSVRAALAGLAALLVGVGLARFAYTPLIPALIAAHWFTPPQAAYLGAANLAGYLAGALLARRMAARVPAATVLRTMIAVATATFFTSAFPQPFALFFVWRFVSGLSGATLMVLGPPTVLAHVPRERHGLVGGVIFTGVGLGVVASGTLVPLLLHTGLVETWIALGGLALVSTIATWNGWPGEPARTDVGETVVHAHRRSLTPALIALYVAYGLSAVGLVPHMLFLVDFIARGLGLGLDVGARYWVLFGAGAICGPMLAGHLADRVGFASAFRIAILVQAGCIGLLATPTGSAGLAVSSFVIGAFVPGNVPLVLGRVHELAAREHRDPRAGWSVATATFALGQAGAALGLSLLFARLASYTVLFKAGTAAFVLALAVEVVGTALDAQRPLIPARR